MTNQLFLIMIMAFILIGIVLLVLAYIVCEILEWIMARVKKEVRDDKRE